LLPNGLPTIHHREQRSMIPVAADDPLGRLLSLSAKAVREWVDGRLADAGSSLATWIVLSQTMDGSEPSQRQLAERVGIGGATLVRHLDRLETEGLVVRQPDHNDRRVTRVQITPAGRRHMAKLTKVANAIDADMRALLSADEERVLRDALARLGRHARHAIADEASRAPRRRSTPPNDVLSDHPLAADATGTGARVDETDVA
jgi:MarR family transcriptional regulator, transcriptional regulator for hemolysin